MDKFYEVSFFSEIDKYAVDSYCAVHNTSKEKNLGDITKIDENELPKYTMSCAGSPCQDFSLSGKQQGSMWECRSCGATYNPLTVHHSKRKTCPKCGSSDLNKTRSSLLVEWLRTVKAVKPKWIIYENVKNIIGKKFKETFDMFIAELNEYGYNTYYKVLNAKDYGIPQNRERVYVIGIKKELDNGKFEFPKPFDNGKRLKDMLEDEVDEKFYINNQHSDKLITELIENGKIKELYEGNNTCSVSEKCSHFDKHITHSGTLMARDYKGFSTYSMSAVIEKKKSSDLVTPYDKDSVAVSQATKQGYILCENGGVADLSFPTSKLRRGRVQDRGNTCPTLMSSGVSIYRIEKVKVK